MPQHRPPRVHRACCARQADHDACPAVRPTCPRAAPCFRSKSDPHSRSAQYPSERHPRDLHPPDRRHRGGPAAARPCPHVRNGLCRHACPSPWLRPPAHLLPAHRPHAILPQAAPPRGPSHRAARPRLARETQMRIVRLCTTHRQHGILRIANRTRQQARRPVARPVVSPGRNDAGYDAASFCGHAPRRVNTVQKSTPSPRRAQP